jgi:Flp pilus assembly protein TadG
MRCHFFKNEQGVSGTIFAFSLVPMLGIAGAASDYSRMSTAKTALQTTVDTAALAAISNTTSSPDTNRATQFFNANAAQKGDLLTPTVTVTIMNADRVKVDATAVVKTYFPVTNGNKTISASATAVRGAGGNSNFSISAKFVSSDAWDGNEIYLYRMDAQTKEIIESKMIASNITKKSYNVEMSLGSGEAYGFKMVNIRCGVKQYSPTKNCGQKSEYYTHNNPINVFKVSGSACTSPTTTHYWEDTPVGGDQDYNDMVYSFSCTGSPPIGGMTLVRLEK